MPLSTDERADLNRALTSLEQHRERLERYFKVMSHFEQVELRNVLRLDVAMIKVDLERVKGEG